MNVKKFVTMMRKAASYPFAKQREAIEQAGMDFQAAQGGNFDRAEDADGNAWRQHAPMTIALHGPHDLLILSGDMKRAAMGGAGAVFKINATTSKTTITVGISKTAVPYAWKHQCGDGRIPRRQFFYLPRVAKKPLMVRFREGVIRKVKADLKWQ